MRSGLRLSTRKAFKWDEPLRDNAEMSKKVGNIELISWDSDPLNGQEISVIERAVGRLPEDYRQFLQAANGARVVGDEVRFPFGPTQQDWLYLHAFTEVESTHPPNVL